MAAILRALAGQAWDCQAHGMPVVLLIDDRAVRLEMGEGEAVSQVLEIARQAHLVVVAGQLQGEPVGQSRSVCHRERLQRQGAVEGWKELIALGVVDDAALDIQLRFSERGLIHGAFAKRCVHAKPALLALAAAVESL